MSRNDIFIRLVITDIKRLKNYLLQIILSVMLLLAVCAAAGTVISKNIYKPGSFQTIKLAYYLPDDDDRKYNRLAIGMLEEMRSMQESAEMIQVSSIEEGYRMLEAGDILYLIIVPEQFFSGIMDSTNPKLDIIVKDNSTITSYIANELFLSYAGYLGIAQAGIYSALDTVRAHEFDSNRIYEIQDRVNLIYLDRSLNKDGYIETVDATNEGSSTLIQHYLASALMLSLFFMAFVIMPLLHGCNSGMYSRLSSFGINKFHIFAGRLICTFLALYAAYIPCFAGISIYNGSLNIAGLITAIPAVIIIAAIIALISLLSKNVFSGNMITLITALATTYIGGGLLPPALLPSAIQQLSNIMPGSYIIRCLAQALFGL